MHGRNGQPVQQLAVKASSLANEHARNQFPREKVQIALQKDQHRKQKCAVSRNARSMVDGLSGQNSEFAVEHAAVDTKNVIDIVATHSLRTMVLTAKDKTPNRRNVTRKLVPFTVCTHNGVVSDLAQQPVVVDRSLESVPVPHQHLPTVDETAITWVMLKRT